MSDRELVKASLAALRGMGMNARHAWVEDGFNGIQVDLAGVPSRKWYGADGSLLGHALPLAMPLDLVKYAVPVVEGMGLTAVSCLFRDLGLVYVVAAGDTAERDYCQIICTGARAADWLAEHEGD